MGQRMTVVEYLRTPFEPDCEYLDGEVVERNAGEFPHSQTLAALIGVLAPLRSRLQIQVLPVIHIRIHEERYRVAGRSLARRIHWRTNPDRAAFPCD